MERSMLLVSVARRLETRREHLITLLIELGQVTNTIKSGTQ